MAKGEQVSVKRGSESFGSGPGVRLPFLLYDCRHRRWNVDGRDSDCAQRSERRCPALATRAWSRASEASIGQYDPQLRHIVRKKQQQNTPSVIFFLKTANYIYLQQLQSPIQYYESQSTNIDFISHRTNHITSQMYINSIYNAKYSFSFTVSYKLPQVSIAHKSNINLETSATSGASSCLDPGTTRCGDGVDQISYLRRSGWPRLGRHKEAAIYDG
jgi:hypothetical protein